MNPLQRHISTAFRMLATLCSLTMLAATPSRADLIVQVGSAVAAAGSSGNSIDVTLTNTGPSSVQLDAFSFGLDVDSGITLTGATTAVPSYIFAGFSTFGPNITIDVGPPLTAGDVYDTSLGGAGFVEVGAGATVGLGRVSFDVSPLASGSYPVKLLDSFTSVAFAGNDVPIDSLVNGTIRVTPAAVPEPGSFTLATLGLGALIAFRARTGCVRTI